MPKLNLLIETEEAQSELYQEFAEARALEFKNILAGGTFPVPMQLANRVKLELEKQEPSIKKLVTIISTDPILALRIVSLVNFPHYLRARGTHSLTGAIQQLGFMRLPEVFDELSEGKSFRKLFVGKLSAVDFYQRIVFTSVLSRKLATLLLEKKDLEEQVFIASVAEFAPLFLLAFYRPGVFSTCAIDAWAHDFDIEKSFKRLFHLNLQEASQSLLTTMSMPQDYFKLMGHLSIPPWNKRSWTVEEREQMRGWATCVHIAKEITHEIFRCRAEGTFRELVEDLADKVNLKDEKLYDAISEVPEAVMQSFRFLDLAPLRFPKYLMKLSERNRLVSEKPLPVETPIAYQEIGAALSEIKNSFKGEAGKGLGVFQNAVYATLLSLVKILGFDRSVFLQYDPQTGNLRYRVHFGLDHPELESYAKSTRVSDISHNPDLEAFFKHHAIFNGDPLFGEDWPFVAFPVIKDEISVGVFYADRASNSKAVALTIEQQLALTALAEEWQQYR